MAIKTLTGKIIKVSDQTVTVEVERKVTHPLYGKIIKRTTKLHAHDEKGAAVIGDTVRISETRPVSKTKYFRVDEVLNVHA